MSTDRLAVLRLCNELTKLFPPVGNENAWDSLFQSLSEASLRERIIEHKETHQWLLGSLATASPGSINHLSLWLSGSWKDLAQFLALDLPEGWHKEAITITLLASKWTQMNLAADLVCINSYSRKSYNSLSLNLESSTQKPSSTSSKCGNRFHYNPTRGRY
jgi:hypothetical protein